ncbi:GP41 [Urbanus proteus nucleopolyhedrovirus]|uniref:GP41 n=1 Tax=Urbanus proteus nucleopolyhedrovirus TaxID=1675866 RepID=A0A162GUT9_9ABAC|nr:GP41 [Urbanus proteus nucleopolyhedrovirus]AKR17368.1 GP41 [Urbanus proteus nucleopolyhedrovirus]
MNNNGEHANTDVWLTKCVDYVSKIITYYRTNDMSQLNPQMISLVNTIRDVCIDTNPIDVNVTKKFDNDENLINYYRRLHKELSTSQTVADNIFQPSFVNTVLLSYAQKFYNNGFEQMRNTSLEKAAKHLSLSLQYQVAEAVATNAPIPLPFNFQVANNYLILLLQKANIPINIQNLIDERKNPLLNAINDIINNVIEDLFVKGEDYYFYVLNENNRARITSLKENIGFLAPLSSSANVFEYIAKKATESGKKTSVFSSANFVTSTPIQKQINNKNLNDETYRCRQNLTEMAFQNETLRRFILQQMNFVEK